MKDGIEHAKHSRQAWLLAPAAGICMAPALGRRESARGKRSLDGTRAPVSGAMMAAVKREAPMVTGMAQR